MGEPIYGVILQGMGLIFGKPVIKMGEVVGLLNPQALVDHRDKEKSITWREIVPIIGRPDKIHFLECVMSYEIKDEEIIKKYYESTTGLQLAPGGIKLV